MNNKTIQMVLSAILLVLAGGIVGYFLGMRSIERNPMELLKSEITRKAILDATIPKTNPNSTQGVIARVGSGTIDIKMTNGSSKTVHIGVGTQLERISPRGQDQALVDLQKNGTFSLMNVVAAQASDLAVGQQVIVLADKPIDPTASDISAVKISITEMKK